MANYTCPVCGEATARELITFLDHTNRHILEAIQAKHPEWESPEGVCKKCEEYYEKQLKGS